MASAPHANATIEQVVEIFTHVQQDVPALLPAARWLFAASQFAAGTIEQTVPSTHDLRALQQFLAQRSPALVELLRRLSEDEPMLEALYAEILLDELCHNTTWQHPAEMTTSPPIHALLRACKRRLAEHHDAPAERLLQVSQLLERAARLAEQARQRRTSGDLPEE